MRISSRSSIKRRTGGGERGAALVSTLLISTLLLMGGTALIMTTSMTATTSYDANAEMQAYYSAEAGLQSALKVLRGNKALEAGSGVATGTKMSQNFATSVTPATSNKTGDPMSALATPVCRLSAWLPYSYPTGGLTASTDPSTASRVPLIPTGSVYNPLTDCAYSIEVSDPDSTPAGTEPTRLIISSTGYGPRGAIKRLQMMVRRTAFDLKAPATITLRGADGTGAMHFETGSSGAKNYYGADHAGEETEKPAFATTGPDVSDMIDGISKPDTIEPRTGDDVQIGVLDVESTGIPTGSNTMPVITPELLQTADDARKVLNMLEGMAQDMGGGAYVDGNYSGTVGSTSQPAFKFIDGDCVLDGGAGLLVVTGNLEMNGNPDFEGLILVLGDGTVNRNGGGSGNIYGALIVAKFNRSGGGFLAPWFDTDGGGNSTMQYDSAAIRRALNTTGRPVAGIVER
ncbi:MAG TPA: hypothetical protein VE262_12740 [Blastocatellia bacterium]|nr:hypothetical protein [Blastocatellia bacterium]